MRLEWLRDGHRVQLGYPLVREDTQRYRTSLVRSGVNSGHGLMPERFLKVSAQNCDTLPQPRPAISPATQIPS